MYGVFCWVKQVYSQAALKETYNKSGKVACHQVNSLKKAHF